MATTTIETRIANPAKKGKRKMAKRRLSKAQIAAGFGGKRRKAAVKAARKRRVSAKHRPRTSPKRANPRKRGYYTTKTGAGKREPKRSLTKSQKIEARLRQIEARRTWDELNKKNPTRKKRKRKAGSVKKRAATKRKNTGALYALVNPAGRKKVATKKKKNRQRKRPAGSTKRKNRRVTHRRRSNPGTMGRPSDWLALGSGAIIGGLGATSLPQMVLGASNTGPTGYLAMAASTALLAAAAHFMFGKKMMLTSGVIAGGAGALIKRIIGDYTPFGQYLNAQAGASGLGDYLSGWNFTTPQIIGGNGNTALGTAGSIPVSVAGAGSGAGRALMNV